MINLSLGGTPGPGGIYLFMYLFTYLFIYLYIYIMYIDIV
jgi:hypothetical protein